MTTALFHQVIILLLIVAAVVCAALKEGELATQCFAAAVIVFIFFADATK